MMSRTPLELRQAQNAGVLAAHGLFTSAEVARLSVKLSLPEPQPIDEVPPNVAQYLTASS